MTVLSVYLIFFFVQKTAYEMRISDLSSDLCSSDLLADEIASKEMAPALLRVPSGPPALCGHPGEEFFLVVEGMVEFHMQYYAPLGMEAGDSVYFDAATPHAVIAVGNGEATILTIVSLADRKSVV